MIASAKSCCPASPTLAQPVAAGAEITTGALLDLLASHADKQLVFSTEECELRAGYHVTEVKDGRFSALDCGANPESWRETFIQLWDAAENPERGHMPVGKFLAIMHKVARELPFDQDARLTFEVSDGNTAIRLFRAVSVGLSEDRTSVRVALRRSAASCKPRDRWLENQNPKSCCGAAA